MTERLKQTLIRHEGIRLKPYRCTAGKLTIGVGRNLDDVGISNDEALFLLDRDIEKCGVQLSTNLPWFKSLDEVRQDVLINMCFNIGIKGLLGFARTLNAIKDGRYGDAAKFMLESKWAEQVGGRAVELSHLMETGTYT
jgi:lysozyme